MWHQAMGIELRHTQPGVLVHGRLDLSAPLDTAWELARAWPDAELTTVDSARHLGSDETRPHVLGALNRFAFQAWARVCGTLR
jgi:proline iminopeptidase